MNIVAKDLPRLGQMVRVNQRQTEVEPRVRNAFVVGIFLEKVAKCLGRLIPSLLLIQQRGETVILGKSLLLAERQQWHSQNGGRQ